MGIRRWSDLPVVRLLHASLRHNRTPSVVYYATTVDDHPARGPEPSSAAGENFACFLHQLAAYPYLCQLAINTSSVSY